MSKKIAFTLFELLITIVLIGVVYTLFVLNFQKKEYAKFSLLNLQNFVRLYGDDVAFVCFEDSLECGIFKDQELLKTINFFDNKPTVYTIVSKRYKVKNYLDFFDGHNLRKVFLKIDFYPNGSNSQVLIEYHDKVYYIDNFNSKNNRVFDNIMDFQDYYDNLLAVVRSI